MIDLSVHAKGVAVRTLKSETIHDDHLKCSAQIVDTKSGWSTQEQLTPHLMRGTKIY
jgi:hypothetical protein